MGAVPPASDVVELVFHYPALRSELVSGKAFGGDLLAQETELERVLDSLDGLEPQKDAFAVDLDRMQTLVLEHFRDEQVHVLPMLHDLEDDARRTELGERFVRAMAAAHTHPHPHLPNAAPGNVIGGPAAALLDRMSDGVTAILHKAPGYLPKDQSAPDGATEPAHQHLAPEPKEEP